MFEKILKKELYLVKLSTLFLLLIFLFLIVLQFTGCESTTQSSSNIADVKGNVSGIFNMPYQGVKVTANEKSTVTDNYGNFYISQVEYPYRLLIFDSVDSRCILVPKHDNTSVNNLGINFITDFGSSFFANVNITYPDSLQNAGMKMVFTDFKDKNYYDENMGTSRIISAPMVPGTQYEGALIAMVFTKDNDGHIISYDKYCIKNDITLIGGQNININLTAADFHTIPQNNTYHIILNPISEHTVNIRYLYLTFGSRVTTNFLNFVMFESFSTNAFDVVVPSGLGINCYPIVGYQSSGTQSNSNVFSCITGSTTISPPQPPVLVSPADNASVDLNTELVFNTGLSHVDNKYYKLHLTDSSHAQNQENASFEVFLDKERLLLSDLENIGLGSLKGRTFYWYVEITDNMSLNKGLNGDIQKLNKMMSGSNSRIVRINP